MRSANTLVDALGLQFRWNFVRDRAFYVALAAAPLALVILGWVVPSWSAGIRPDMVVTLSFVLWQPFVEELLFRGIIQGQIRKHPWARREIVRLSGANIAASLLFAAAHLAYHPPAWALAVIGPSLVFGYFRDRYSHLLPSLLLHAAYNGCYLIAGSYLG